MKQEMANNQMEHLRYLDYEEHWLEERINKFNQFSKNYDAFLDVRRKL